MLRWLSAALALPLLPAAGAGSLAAPELTDPEGDAVHYEEQHQEPSLDVTEAWVTWRDGAVEVGVRIVNLTTPGPAGTEDPVDDRTYVDVHWDTGATEGPDEDPWVARLRVDADGEERFLAGQARVVERKAWYGPETEHRTLHGDVQPVTGTVVRGAPGLVLVRVPAEAVGGPGPGDVLQDVRFSTYVDHHQGTPDADLHHHPGHVDLNDSEGADHAIPEEGAADDGAGDPGSGGDEESGSTPASRFVPAPGLGALAGAVLAAARRRDP
jgi:hypothetical protein